MTMIPGNLSQMLLEKNAYRQQKIDDMRLEGYVNSII